ncbi:anti-sigma factor family protein [Chloroflexota bacterium]
MKCKDIRWMFALYNSGELSPEEQEMAETHLVSCEKCRQELARISKVPELIQSLQGETWWADVNSSVKEHISAAVKEHISAAKEKPGGLRGDGITTGMPIWQPASLGSLAMAVMERPIWRRVLVSALALIIIAATSIVIIRPWGDNDITQLALDTAKNNSQVQALLGEEIPETTIEHMGGVVQVKFTTMEVIVSAVVNLDNLRVTAIHRQALIFQPPGPPTDRPELTEDEKAEVLAIVQDDLNVQVFLSHGYILGEPDSTHHVLGDDARRVAWLPLKGMVSDDYKGVIVDLDDYQDVTVMWSGEIPNWWPFIQ